MMMKMTITMMMTTMMTMTMMVMMMMIMMMTTSTVLMNILMVMIILMLFMFMVVFLVSMRGYWRDFVLLSWYNMFIFLLPPHFLLLLSMGIHRKNWDMQSPEKGLHAL